MNLHHGDCLEVMAGMEPESVDAICTDPPYGLEFMGKEWDKLTTRTRGGVVGRAGRKEGTLAPVEYGTGAARMTYACGECGKRDKFQNAHACQDPTWSAVYLPSDLSYGRSAQAFHGAWAEAAYRVAKPSAYLLAFGGTRTVHRMTVALEDAGWIIRDMLVWAYASGFPKSKASLKPAWEPIVMARKPGPLRMLAIDECRIPGATEPTRFDPATHSHNGYRMDATGAAVAARNDGLGRWPANVILTDPIFDGGIEGVVGGGETVLGGGTGRGMARASAFGFGAGPGGSHDDPECIGDYDPEKYGMTERCGANNCTCRCHRVGAPTSLGDSGTYSRFFLVPKADRGDREPVLGGQVPTRRPPGWSSGEQSPGTFQSQPTPARENVHPTVKPVDLMRHLVRLVTPTGGVVLDPFGGSGTTALAAEMEGFPWILIEREEEYVRIAEARLNGVQRGLGLAADAS